MNTINLPEYMPLLDAIDSMVCVIRLDGEIITCNAFAANLLGYSKADLVGKNVLFIHQTGTENEVAKVMQDLVDASETICRLPVVTRDGICIDVETHIYKANWESELVYLGFSKDIRSEVQSERKWKAVFYASPIPIAVTRVSDGKVIEVNDAWLNLMEYSRDEVIGKTTNELCVFFDQRDRDELLERIDENGRLLNEHIHFRTQRAHDIYGLFSATQLDIDGELCWITSLVDETEKVKLREQINDYQEASITSALEQLHQQLANNKFITIGDDEVEYDWADKR